MPDTNLETLSRVELLADLSAAERRTLEQSCRWRRYAAHEQIIDRQSDTRDVFFVVEGQVRVVNYSLSGREITLDDFGIGGIFGELAAIDGQPRSASVMALKPSLIAAIPPDLFLSILERNPKVAIKVMKHLTAVVRNSTERIMDLSTLAANNRVQADLLRQARANMKGDNVAEIRPIPVHGDIASRVSTTRETVARVLNDLARKGIVERRKDSLVVQDVERLRQLVEEVRGD
jgi:CRP-like cAMP-binding protein